MRFKKLFAVVIAAAMTLSTLSAGGAISAPKAQASDFTDLNQSEIVSAMGAGWNLGNQLESALNGTPSETNWGNPVINEDLIKAVKNAGFKSIRIPVSYLSKIGSAPGYTIDSSWLNRIQQVVNMCINNGLYAIINMHGDGYNSIDGGWLLCNGSDQTTIRAKYQACWEQIAARFKDYDEHLIFESMNEEFDGSYSTPNSTYYSNINQLNQIFVNTVRQTGGNNDKRWLLLPGWNTDIEYTTGNYGFQIPSDNYLSSSVASGQKRIMISVHYYDPWDFCGERSSSVTQWGPNATNSSKVASYGDVSYLITMFQKLYTSFTSQGYPVVIGEYGAIDKSVYDSVNTTCRADFASKVCTYAKQYGCVPIWWDNGVTDTYGFALFNRNTYAVTQQSIIDAIMDVYENGTTNPDNPSTDTLIFSGDTDESYSTSNASWLTNANDNAIITLKYTCTDTSHANWGVLGWGGTVDGEWVNGTTYNAAGTATDTVTVTCTAAQLKSSLSISGNSSVSYLALNAYNGGKIIRLSISSPSGTNITLNANNLTRGAYTSDITYNDFTIGASSEKYVSVESCSATIGGTTFTQRLKMNGGGNSAGRYISFSTTGACTVTVMAASTTDSDTKTLRLSSGSVGGTTVGDNAISTAGTITYNISGAGTYYLYSVVNGVYIYNVAVTY